MKLHHRLGVLLLGWSLCGAAGAANFTSASSAAAKFGVHGITFTGNGRAANPFDTLASVTFTPPSGAGQAKTVFAFFDGGNTWRARVYVGYDTVVRLVRTGFRQAAAVDPRPARPVSPAPAVAKPRNLAGNPGFELGTPEPWALNGTGASLRNGEVHSGRAALHLPPGTSAVQTLKGLEPGALYVVRGWLRSVKGKAEMTYFESHKERNGKYLFAGGGSGTGKYELTTLLFRPELDPVSSRGHVDVKLKLYTEDDTGEALMDDFEVYRGELAGPDLLGATHFDAAELARWSAGGTEPVIVPEGGPGGGPCMRLVKKGYMSRLIEGLAPNTTYAATAWVRGQWFRFGAGRHGYRNDHISINSTAEFVPRTIGFTTAPGVTTASIYFLMPADGRPAFIDSVEVRRVDFR